jgi:hypothetical protein
MIFMAHAQTEGNSGVSIEHVVHLLFSCLVLELSAKSLEDVATHS